MNDEKPNGFLFKLPPKGNARGRMSYHCDGCNVGKWGAGFFRRLFGAWLPWGWQKFREGVYCKTCRGLISVHRRINGDI